MANYSINLQVLHNKIDPYLRVSTICARKVATAYRKRENHTV